jgi:alkylation response protein AidB-like acyl-CoA dehydrogenase
MRPEERAGHARRRAIHYARSVDDEKVYAQSFSEGGAIAAAAGARPFATAARPVDGGWRVDGREIIAPQSGHADYYGVLCTVFGKGEAPNRRNTLYLAVPARAAGVRVTGDWDPLGMRGTVSLWSRM